MRAAGGPNLRPTGFLLPPLPHSVDAARLHRRAILFMVVAPLCWSSGGLLVRLLSFRDAWEIVFWRSLFMALFVAGTLVVLHGRRVPQAVRSVGWPGLLAGAFLAGQFFLFIASLTRTTVANTFVLMSVSPFLAALAARLLLREAVPMRTWIAMSVAFGGMVIMFSDSLDAGRLSGNLLAVGVSVLFALNVTVLRKVHATVDMLPTVMIAGLMSIAVALPLAAPFEATPRDLAVLAVLGCVQLGTGCLLMVAASRHLTATELGLLALLEPILGPVWVWALLGEAPGPLALAGGAIVLGAVIANEAWAAWRGRSPPAVLAPPAATPGP
ncbi:MAG: membrane protein [Betaproteobacteria bacterium]|nr:MAG: membrane protein [Betaproteobacteria bacterium]